MTPLYDARGNIYAVATPQMIRALGIDLPLDAEQAVSTRKAWAAQAISALCDWPDGQQPAGAKAHRSDGLLIGPFQHSPVDAEAFDLLIVNTDGNLAERSGNGLTIFAQFLTDSARIPAQTPFALQVHHDKTGSPAPVTVEPTQVDGVDGFWLDLGQPAFGPLAVDANTATVGTSTLNGRTLNRVNRLQAIDGDWDCSVFVRIGNPHCVTLVSSPQQLPTFEQLHLAPLHDALTRIAFAAGESGMGDPCPAGVNLQWACVVAPQHIQARVFERGEGPTASSGTSASAVACAAWTAGWVNAGTVLVEMPGGTAPVRLVEKNGLLERVFLFGTARLGSA
jgi:diaminopimelate epimerase